MRRLAAAAVLALIVGACSGSPGEPSTPEPDDGEVSTPTGDTAGGAAQDDPASGDPTLAADMVRIDGTIVTGHADAATDGELTGPFTFQVPSRGGGNGAVFNPVSVDGVVSSIVWDGGRPLTLSGPALHMDGIFAFDGGAITFDLSRSALGLPPGEYALAGPVAVGDPSGLATPADGVNFVAGPGSAVLGTGLSWVVVPGSVVLLGPGSLDMSGAFTITTATGSTSAATVHLAEGSFEITVTPTGDGAVAISGLARGAGWA